MEARWLRRRELIPYVILLASLVVTATTAWYVRTSRVQQDRHQFEMNAEVIRGTILSRLDAYVAMLLGGAGLFAASEVVTREEFKAYVARLELADRYPGIQGVGFSRLLRADEREAVLAEIRRDDPSAEFSPPQAHRGINAIVYLEPSDVRNREALGYDMGSEATRREAMNRARDSGSPAATGTVVLVQERATPGQEQAGFLIYVPVYTGGSVPESVEARRRGLQGFVYSPFRADDLLEGIIGPELRSLLSFEVFDGPSGEGRLLHRSRPQPDGSTSLDAERTLDVAGRTWTIVVHGEDDLHALSRRALVGMVGAGGVMLSLLLFIITRGQIAARTQAERTAEILRESEERLRGANRAKDDFLATISHELRTPLNAIAGWASMLGSRTVPPDMQMHAVTVIARNAAAQTRLVEDLLDMSRAAAGHLALQLGEVDTRAVLEGAMETVQPSAGAAALTLELRIQEPLGRIHADGGRLQQIVTNLLSNAIKFTPAGGRVTVGALRVDDMVTVRVSDTGIGIEPAFMPFVFERFRQEDSSSTRMHPGVGLGLAIARHLARLHGGTLEATSAGRGQGATFELRIPLQQWRG